MAVFQAQFCSQRIAQEEIYERVGGVNINRNNETTTNDLANRKNESRLGIFQKKKNTKNNEINNTISRKSTQ